MRSTACTALVTACQVANRTCTRFGTVTPCPASMSFHNRVVASNKKSRAELGNPAGRERGSRNRLSEEVICALLRDFRQHGQKAVARVRQTQPAAYLKILALLCPREHKVEHSNLIKELSDEQLEAMIAHLETSLAAQARGPIKVIEGISVEVQRG